MFSDKHNPSLLSGSKIWLYVDVLKPTLPVKFLKFRKLTLILSVYLKNKPGRKYSENIKYSSNTHEKMVPVRNEKISSSLSSEEKKSGRRKCSEKSYPISITCENLQISWSDP